MPHVGLKFLLEIFFLNSQHGFEAQKPSGPAAGLANKNWELEQY